MRAFRLIATFHDDDEALVVITGHVDRVNAAAAGAMIEVLTAYGARQMVVDMSQADCCPEALSSYLSRLRIWLAGAGGWLVLDCPPSWTTAPLPSMEEAFCAYRRTLPSHSNIGVTDKVAVDLPAMAAVPLPRAMEDDA